MDEDEEGFFVPGYRVCPDSDEIFADLKIRSCPIALSNRMSVFVESFSRHKQGFFDLSSTFPKPTVAVLEAFDTLDLHFRIFEQRLQKRSLEEIKNG